MPGEAWVLACAVVLLGAALAYEHRRLSEHADATQLLLNNVETNASARHMDTLDLLSEFEKQLANHSHPHEHAAEPPLQHDHPHQHEHIQHVHELEPASHEITEGQHVTVRRCRHCNTIFRDRAA